MDVLARNPNRGQTTFTDRKRGLSLVSSTPVRTLALAAALGVTAQVLFVAAPQFAAELSGLTSDKLMHALVFGGLAVLAWVAFGGRSLATPFALAMAVGLLDEASQWMSPGREPSFADLAADAFGAGAALFLASWLAGKKGTVPFSLRAEKGTVPFFPTSQGG